SRTLPPGHDIPGQGDDAPALRRARTRSIGDCRAHRSVGCGRAVAAREGQKGALAQARNRRTRRRARRAERGRGVMSRKPQSHEMRRKWAGSVVAVEDAEASEGRRERVVARTAIAIERGAAEARAARRRARWGAMLAAAAVVLLAVGAVWRARLRANEVAVR